MPVPSTTSVTFHVWTDKPYFSPEETLIVHAKVVDFDGTPSMPEEGTKVEIKIAGAGALYLKKQMDYDPSTSYYILKDVAPKEEGAYEVSVLVIKDSTSASSRTDFKVVSGGVACAQALTCGSDGKIYPTSCLPSGVTKAEMEKCKLSCPDFSPPGPDMIQSCIEKGGKFVIGERDQLGCPYPPKCILPTQVSSSCPEFATIGPDFKKNCAEKGGVVVEGMVGSDGCRSPPKCVSSGNKCPDFAPPSADFESECTRKGGKIAVKVSPEGCKLPPECATSGNVGICICDCNPNNPCGYCCSDADKQVRPPEPEKFQCPPIMKMRDEFANIDVLKERMAYNLMGNEEIRKLMQSYCPKDPSAFKEKIYNFLSGNIPKEASYPCYELEKQAEQCESANIQGCDKIEQEVIPNLLKSLDECGKREGDAKIAMQNVAVSTINRVETKTARGGSVVETSVAKAAQSPEPAAPGESGSSRGQVPPVQPLPPVAMTGGSGGGASVTVTGGSSGGAVPGEAPRPAMPSQPSAGGGGAGFSICEPIRKAVTEAKNSVDKCRKFVEKCNIKEDCNFIRDEAKKCKEMLSDEKTLVEKATAFLVDRCSDYGIKTRVDEMEKNYTQSEILPVVITMNLTISDSGLSALKAFFKGDVKEVTEEGSKMYLTLVQASDMEKIGKTEGVISVKVDHLLRKDIQDAVKKDMNITATKKLPNMGDIMSALAIASQTAGNEAPELGAAIGNQQKELMNITGNVRNIEDTENKKGIGYMLGKLVGFFRDNEIKDADYLRQQADALKNSALKLRAIADASNDESMKMALQAQSDELKKRADEMLKEAEDKKRSAAGIFSIFSGILGGG